MKIVFIDEYNSEELQKLSSKLCMLGQEVSVIYNLECIIYKHKTSTEKDGKIFISSYLVNDKNRFRYYPLKPIPTILFSLIISVYIPLFYRTGDIYFYHGGRILGFLMKLAQKLLHKPVIPLNEMPRDIKEFEKTCYKEYDNYFKSKSLR